MRNILKIIKAGVNQSATRVSSEGLINAQFTDRLDKFVMGDLIIYKIGVLFYFRLQSGKLKEIKNMFTVSRLVYGKIKYQR